jgi:hypothetical protein
LGADAAEQLADGEELGEVVVGADLEPDTLSTSYASRGSWDGRDPLAGLIAAAAGSGH